MKKRFVRKFWLAVLTTMGMLFTSPPHKAESNPQGATGSEGTMLELSNADVSWDATYDGFLPRVSERATVAFRTEPVSTLLELLSDPERFVVAHVGLTQIAGLKYSTFPTWNGLSIQLEPDGRTTIDPEQCHALAKRWRSWYTSATHPPVLP